MLWLLALVVLVLAVGLGALFEFALWSVFVIALVAVIAVAIVVGQVRARA